MLELLGNLWSIATKPDNIPIVGMLLLVLGFTFLALRLALANDRLRSTTGPDAQPVTLRSGGKQTEPVRDIMYPASEQGWPAQVLTWPYLLRLELLAAMFVMVLLIVWSVLIDAPLEQRANPGLSPNPAKAPWYFLGLQEMLVYFDPWIAGVALPLFIIFGLMALPYLDVNPKGNGYYALGERRYVIGTFLFGFLLLWVLFIVIGTFVRGPGWMWFWPWQDWDPYRVVSETNINLNELLAELVASPRLATHAAGFYIGGFFVLGYYFLGFALPYGWLRRHDSPTLQKLGLVRYLIVAFLLLSMLGLPIKILMRLLFNVKYFWVTPWFNV